MLPCECVFTLVCLLVLPFCLSSTGSVVNKMFHQILFDTCLNTVSNCWPQSLVKKRKKDTLKSSQADGKRSKPHRKDNDEVCHRYTGNTTLPLCLIKSQWSFNFAKATHLVHSNSVFVLSLTQQMDVDEDEEQDEEVHLSPQDLLKIREGVVLLVKSLLRLLLKFPLKDEPQSADNCVQVILDSASIYL